jgi:hypothetical protein
MAKEVSVKIRVDGKEIQVTQQLLDLLKNSAQVSAEEIEQLEMAMKGTSDATKEATKNLDDLDETLKETKKDTQANTQAVKEAEQEYTSMGERVGKLEDKLATLRLENKQGTEEYKKTAKEIRRLRDVQEELDISTQRTLTTFSQIPGPIGFIAGGFESLRVATKSAQLGLKNLGFSFKTLDKAIASTGIGALVVLFGLLVAAVIKAFQSFKPLQDAVARFGTLFEVLGEVIQPVIDLIGQALTAALNFLSKAIAFVTGNLDEFNKKLADKAAAEAAAKQQERLRKEFELTGDMLTEQEQKITQARLDAADQRDEIRKNEEYSETEKAYYIRLVNERLQRDITKINQEEADKRSEIEKKAAEERARKAEERRQKRLAEEKQRLQDEQNFQDELTALENANALARIESENDRIRQQIEFEFAEDVKAAERKYKDQEKLQQILSEINEKYRLKRLEQDEKERKEREEADKEAAEKRKAAAEKELQDKKDQLADELRLLELRNAVLTENTQAYFDNIRAIEQKAYEQRLLDAGENAELREAIEKEHQENLRNIKQQEIQAYGEVAAATLNSIVAVGNAIASSYDEEAKTSKKAFEQRKKLQKATAIMSAASGLIQILTQPSTLPSPFDWIVKLANAAALGVATAVQIKNINKTKFEGDTATGAAGGGITSQRGYAKGGMIGGRRHAQGGTLIEAEAGEAVMTRGAVDRFGPMLSMMNQLGGGVSFNSETSITSFDNPTVRNPQGEKTPTIIKTYVVEQELTTSQEQASRLKDLSTL